MKLYTNETCSEEATVIGENNVLVLESAEKNSYKYYKVGPASVKIESINFSRSGSAVTATASVKYSSSDSVPVTMIMVLKDSDGFIRKVLSTDTRNISNTSETMSLTDSDSSAYTAEVFFIEDWSSRHAISYNIYSE